MAEINIIEEEKPLSIVELTAQERELIFDELSRPEGPLSRADAKVFNDIFNEVVEEDRLRSDISQFQGLTMKKVLEILTFGQKNSIIFPLVSFPQDNESTREKYISIKFNYIAEVMNTKDNGYYLKYAEENIRAVGLVFSPNRVNQSLPVENALKNAIINYFAQMSKFTLLDVSGEEIKLNYSKIEGCLDELFEELSLFRDTLFYLATIPALLNSSYPPRVIKPRVPTPEKKRPPIEAIVTQLEGKYRFKIASTGDAKYVDLKHSQLAEIINTLAIFGEKSTHYDDAVAEYTKMQNDRTNDEKFLKEFEREKNVLSIYRALIKNKLGATKLNTLGGSYVNHSQLLSLLSKNERRVIEAEYEKIIKYAEAEASNKCPHVKDYKAAIALASFKDKSIAIAKLLRNYSSGRSEGIIKCRLCSFNLICPHVIKLNELRAHNAPYVKVRGEMMRFTSNEAISNQYYCRYCAESLISDDEIYSPVLSDNITTREDDEELKTLVWREIAYNMRFIQFDKVYNTNAFITTIQKIIYHHFAKANDQLKKSKTSSFTEIESKRNIKLTIFIFAAFIKLIEKQPGKLGFSGLPSRNLTDLFKFAINTILSIKNPLLQNIQDISAETIKLEIIDAYKQLEITKEQAGPPASRTLINVAALIAIDPIYVYARRIYNLFVGGKKKTNEYDQMEAILGHASDKIDRAKYYYADIFKIKYDKTAKKNPNDLMAEYQKRIFSVFSDWLKKCYLAPVYTMAGKKETGEEIVNISAEHARINEEFAAAKDMVADYNNDLMIKRAKIWGRSPQDDTKKFKRRKEAHLSRMYDENGNEHKWDLIVLKDGTTLSNAEIRDALSAGKPRFKKELFAEYKCSVCKKTQKEAFAISNDKISAKLTDKTKRANLALFYKKQCPKGGMHEIEGGVCKKCGLGQISADEYFKKFENDFDKQIKEIGRIEKSKEAEEVAPSQSNLREMYKEWSFGFSEVLKLTKKYKIDPKLIMAIGAYEKQDFSSIKDGTFVAPEIDNIDNTRIYVIYGYINQVIIHYNYLRNSSRALRLHPFIGAIVQESSFNKYELSELKKLPDFGAGVIEKLEYFKLAKKPRECVSFGLQTLCNLLNNISELNKIGDVFSRMLLERILKSEEMLTKAGYFKWSIINPKNEKIFSSPAAVDDDDFVSEDDRRMSEAEREEVKSAFSNDALDTEENYNEDRDPDETNENEQQFGDDINSLT